MLSVLEDAPTTDQLIALLERIVETDPDDSNRYVAARQLVERREFAGTVRLTQQEKTDLLRALIGDPATERVRALGRLAGKN